MSLKEILVKDQGDKGVRRKPNRIIIIIIAAAVLLLALPSFSGGGNSDRQASDKPIYDTSEYVTRQEHRLEGILEKINGAGDVSVFITVSDGGEKVPAKDVSEKMSKGKESYEEERESNIVTGSKSGGEPYIVEERTPEISGVLVVAKGASSEAVREEIYDAIKAVYGIAPHRIKIAY